MAYVIRFKPAGHLYVARRDGTIGFTGTVDEDAIVLDTREDAERFLADNFSEYNNRIAEVVAYDPWTMS